MVISLILNMVAILLASLSSKGRKSYGVEAAFVLLAAFMGLRYGYGNDYFNYLNLYEQYNSSSIGLFDFARYSEMRTKEFAWVFLCKLFKPFGYFGFIIFISALENFIVYKFVKRYVNSSYYWLAVFVYTFNPNLYLIGCASMMRQWLAVCVFLLSFKYIYERKLLKYLLIVTLATIIHSSAIILYPVYLLVFFDKVKINTLTIGGFVILLAAWYALASSLLGVLSPLLLAMDEWNSYEEMLMSAKGTSFGFGALGVIVVTIMCLTQIKNYHISNTIATLIYSLNLFITPIVMLVPMASRFNTYFFAMSILVYPVTAESLFKNNKYLGGGFLALIMLYLLYMWHGVLTGEVWSWSFLEYHTIFEQPWQ